MQEPYALGWAPELPDIRDWMIDEHPEALRMLTKRTIFKGVPAVAGFPLQALPDQVELLEHCSPIENQGRLGSCTAQAGVGLVEYLERRALGNHVDGSRLFLYKVTRNILGWTGDTGAYCRTTLKALAKYGVCEERFWPYVISEFDKEPSAFCYASAATAKALRYFRLDRQGTQTGEALLQLVKTMLALGMPLMFGFTVYNFGDSKGQFAMPVPGDRVRGGHAVVAVGYDDSRVITKSKGALLIRNSWGTHWGESGYGWLPYDYVRRALTRDWWTIFAQDYIGD